jgi:glycoprotein 2-beta-D-xylosyltransferase
MRVSCGKSLPGKISGNVACAGLLTAAALVIVFVWLYFLVLSVDDGGAWGGHVQTQEMARETAPQGQEVAKLQRDSKYLLEPEAVWSEFLTAQLPTAQPFECAKLYGSQGYSAALRVCAGSSAGVGVGGEEASTELRCRFNDFLGSAYCAASQVRFSPSRMGVLVREAGKSLVFRQGLFSLERCGRLSGAGSDRTLPLHQLSEYGLELTRAMSILDGADAGETSAGEGLTLAEAADTPEGGRAQASSSTVYAFVDRTHSEADHKHYLRSLLEQWFAVYAVARMEGVHPGRVRVVFTDGVARDDGALWARVFPRGNVHISKLAKEDMTMDTALFVSQVSALGQAKCRFDEGQAQGHNWRAQAAVANFQEFIKFRFSVTPGMGSVETKAAEGKPMKRIVILMPRDSLSTHVSAQQTFRASSALLNINAIDEQLIAPLAGKRILVELVIGTQMQLRHALSRVQGADAVLTFSPVESALASVLMFFAKPGATLLLPSKHKWLCDTAFLSAAGVACDCEADLFHLQDDGQAELDIDRFMARLAPSVKLEKKKIPLAAAPPTARGPSTDPAGEAVPPVVTSPADQRVVVSEEQREQKPTSGEGEREKLDIFAMPAQTDCARMFGNGFSTKIAMCAPHGEDPAQRQSQSEFTCYQNQKIAGSICMGTNLVLDSDKVRVSHGGEEIDTVLKRDEKDEFPTYTQGAFSLACEQTGAMRALMGNMARRDSVLPNYMHQVVEKMSFTPGAAGEGECVHTFEDPVLMITRYEYANLYHAMGDWYDAFQVMRIFGVDESKVKVLFLDGHSKGTLDNMWTKLFGESVYVKHLPAGKVCFKQFALVHPSYSSGLGVPLMTNKGACANSDHLQEFKKHVLHSFDVPRISTSALSASSGEQQVHVALVLRGDYMAHPRLKAVTAKRKISNEKEVVAALQALPGMQVDIVRLEQLSMQEQLRKIHEADVVVGVHGAGLSHVLFMHDGAKVVEILPNGFGGRFHFEFMAHWSGHPYVKVGDSRMSGTFQTVTVVVPSLVRAVKEAVASYVH